MYFPNVPFVLLVIFTILKLSTSLPNCGGITHSECDMDAYLLDETDLDNNALCLKFCAVVGGCHFSVFDTEPLGRGNCRLYKRPFSDYIVHCKQISGQRELPDGCDLENPQDNSCQIYRSASCDFGSEDETDVLDSWEDCHQFCISNSECQLWQFEKEQGLCKLHHSRESSCTWQISPRDPSFDKCVNEGFLLLGGYDDNEVDNVEAYGSNLSLPSLPSLPLPLLIPIAEMTESGAIYVAGGVTSDQRMINSINDKTWMLSSLSSSKWEELEARMQIPVWRSSSVVVKDSVLVLGGDNGSDSDDVIQLLDTSKSLPTWELLSHSKLPEPLDSHSAAVFESQVIIVTRQGVTFTTSVSSIISDSQLHWVRGELPGVQVHVSGPSIEVVEDKLVAVFGRKVFTKTTMDSQWVQLEHLPQEKWNYPSIGSVRGSIVIGGGSDGLRASATVFMWVEASSEWEEVTSLKIPRCDHATVQLHRGIM